MTEQWQELKETIIELRDNDGTGTQQEVCKFLANYMDVLEKQMQEPSGDLISREATLEKAVYTETEEGWYGYTVDVDYIKSLPPVTPQLKTGYWIRGHHGFGCSNCHKSIEGEWDDNIDDITGTLFCPNCGARMESEA